MLRPFLPRGCSQNLLLFEINRENEERSPKLKLVEFDQNDYWPNPHGLISTQDLPNGILLESAFLNISYRNNFIFDLKNVAKGKISATRRLLWQ